MQKENNMIMQANFDLDNQILNIVHQSDRLDIAISFDDIIYMKVNDNTKTIDKLDFYHQSDDLITMFNFQLKLLNDNGKADKYSYAFVSSGIITDAPNMAIVSIKIENIESIFNTKPFRTVPLIFDKNLFCVDIGHIEEELIPAENLTGNVSYKFINFQHLDSFKVTIEKPSNHEMRTTIHNNEKHYYEIKTKEYRFEGFEYQEQPLGKPTKSVELKMDNGIRIPLYSIEKMRNSMFYVLEQQGKSRNGKNASVFVNAFYNKLNEILDNN